MALCSRLERTAIPPRETADIALEVEKFREFVFRGALAVCGEPDGAEDVAQEVLLTLYRIRKNREPINHPEAWLRRVTVRCAMRHLKRRRASHPIPDNARAAEMNSDSLAVYAVLRQLTPEERAILGMALNQGLSYREIGAALGIPEGTVASRLNSAKKSFQKRWER